MEGQVAGGLGLGDGQSADAAGQHDEQARAERHVVVALVEGEVVGVCAERRAAMGVFVNEGQDQFGVSGEVVDCTSEQAAFDGE